MAPRQVPAWLAAVFLSFSLVSACTTIRLVPAYDQQIDEGLTKLYAETSGFVDRMRIIVAMMALTMLAVQNAINATLDAIRDFVNGLPPIPLL